MTGTAETARALLRHATRVIATRDQDRDSRVDLALPKGIAARLDPDTAARFESLVGIALTAIEAADLRRARDTFIARGRPDRAQPLGGRLAVAEQTIQDLVSRVATRRERERKDPDDQARELAPVYAEALATGCTSDKEIGAFLEARVEAPITRNGTGRWTAEAAAALRRRLTRLGLAPEIRPVRSRTRPRTPDRLTRLSTGPNLS